MSFIDSILGRAPAATQAPVQQPATQQQSVEQVGAKEPPNPLDLYTKMYEASNTNPETPPTFELDDAVLNDVSSKLNFTTGINQDLIAKAQSGDAKAMVDLIQAVSQKAYSAALKHGTALTDVHLEKRRAFDDAALSKNVKNTLTNEALSAIPNASHPVVKTELRRIAESLAKQNPDASASEIATEAQKYFATVYSAMTSKSAAADDNSIVKAGEVQDWEKFLSP